MRRLWWLPVLVLVHSFSAQADTTGTAAKLANELEVGIVVAGGNSDAQTYTVKEQTVYPWGGNLIKGFGHYLLGKSAGLKTAENWDLGARYERELSDAFSVFGQYKLDSNVFAGLDLRHTFDAGGKYFIIKQEGQQLFNETGYRFTSENRLAPAATVGSHFARVYFEYNRSLGELVTAKLGLELLPNFSNSNDYQANLEAALLASLSPVFSVKSAYTIQYRNQPAGAGKNRSDTLFTTSIVAKF